MQDKSDAELVQQAQAGDKAAFGVLYRRYQTLVNRLALRLVSSDECACELMQDAMLQAYLSLSQIREPEKFKGWLCGIVVNLCRSFLRDQKIVFYSLESVNGGLTSDALMLTGVDPSPESLAEEQELHQVILKAINTLPSGDRAITLAFYYDQLSVQEIAGMFKMSPGAVKVRLHRARSKLKEGLLSQNAELKPYQTRRKKMVKVKITDVVKSEKQDEKGQKFYLYAVILEDEIGKRAMPVWIGPAEGQAIAMELGNISTPRPLTFNFFATVLKAIDATLEEVKIDELKKRTFYAKIKIRCGGKIQEVDARPSDAMALALLLECPITVTESVMKQASVKIPEKIVAPTGKTGAGTGQILNELSGFLNQFKGGFPMSSEEIRKSNQDLINRVYQPEGEVCK